MMRNFYKKSLHRSLLEIGIKKLSSLVHGKVLDIGSKNRRYDNEFSHAVDIVAIDLKSDVKKNVMSGDVKNLPFKDECFDSVISFETMEYIFEIEQALFEIKRVLRKDGVFCFSVPMLNPIHGTAEISSMDSDLIRLTNRGWNLLLKKYFSEFKISPFGGRWSLMFDIYFDWIRKSKLFLKIILFPLNIFLMYLLQFLDSIEKNKRFPMGFVIYCRK